MNDTEKGENWTVGTCLLFISLMLRITPRGLEMLKHIVFDCLPGQLRLAKILSDTVNVLKHYSVVSFSRLL